jgi:hypothetical protein
MSCKSESVDFFTHRRYAFPHLRVEVLASIVSLPMYSPLKSIQMTTNNFKHWLAAGIISTSVLTACGPGGDSKRTGDDYERNTDDAPDNGAGATESDHTQVNNDSTDYEMD